jgi:Polyketide cyclase / dehydrase and lipid transport
MRYRTARWTGAAEVTVLRHTQEIDRPVADVFSKVVNGGDFAAWNPTVTASRQLTPGPPAEGTRFEWKLRGFGNVEQELQEFEVDQRVRIVPHHRSLAGGHRFTFTDLGGRTRVDHELEMIPKGVFVIFGPLMGVVGGRNLRATASALEASLT